MVGSEMIRKDVLTKAVDEYNKYHGAEARIKVIKQYTNTNDHLLMRLEGPFCQSCAPEEYYVDFQMLLQEQAKLKMEIESVKTGRKRMIVDFKLTKAG